MTFYKNDVIFLQNGKILTHKPIMKITTLKNLAAIIKAERKKQGLTQADVAFASNVGVRYIVDLEKGKETCQIGKAIHVMNMLGIEINIE